MYTNTFLEWCIINLLSKNLCNPCLNWLYFQPLYVMSLESCNLSCPSFIPKPCLLNTCLLYWCSECTVNSTPLIILYISIQDLIILSDLLGRSFSLIVLCSFFFQLHWVFLEIWQLGLYASTIFSVDIVEFKNQFLMTFMMMIKTLWSPCCTIIRSQF